MEEDYKQFVLSIRTYIEVLTKFEEIFNIIKSRTKGLKLKTGSIINIESSGENVRFYVDDKGTNKSTLKYCQYVHEVNKYFNVIKMSGDIEPEIEVSDVGGNNGVSVMNASYRGKGTSITFTEGDIKRSSIISNIDDFTEEMYFQYSSSMDDPSMFYYVLLMCSDTINLNYCIALETQYYTGYSVESAQDLLSTFCDCLEVLKNE